MEFPVGQLLLRRQFQRGAQLGRVWAGRVAGDDERGLRIWIANGSPYVDVAAADGRDFRDVAFADWRDTPKVLRHLTFRGDVLMLHPPGRAHSVWFFFSPTGRFRFWYVNLEQPLRRWHDGGAAGIDTVDQDLDLVVAPDRTWRWKDEGEFSEHLGHPDVYWVDDGAAVRAEGERVAQLIEAGAFPFDGTFTDAGPDPAWPPITALPPGWDRPRA